MAADNATMTPEQAIAVLGETRQYRETLTARAVGIIWLVWGAMLALLTTADMALYFGAELADISFPNGLMFAFTALFVGLGGAITNLVWRAHALETDPRPRGWIVYVVAAVLVVAVIILANLSDRLYNAMGWQSATLVSPVMWLVIDGALVITLLTRRHVSIWPGMMVMVASIAFDLFLTFGGIERTPQSNVMWGAAIAIYSIVAFAAAGLWTYNRG